MEAVQQLMMRVAETLQSPTQPAAPVRQQPARLTEPGPCKGPHLLKLPERPRGPALSGRRGKGPGSRPRDVCSRKVCGLAGNPGGPAAPGPWPMGEHGLGRWPGVSHGWGVAPPRLRPGACGLSRV